MQLRIKHLERRQSFRDILCGKLLLTANCDVCHLGIHSVHHPLEPHLLEIQNDVLHSLDDSRNGRKLLVHAGNLYRADSKTFQRREQNAAEGVSDGLSIARLKWPELETADGVRSFEHYDLIRFLKC